MKIEINSFYKFAPLKPLSVKEEALNLGRSQGIKGTILLAEEGMNGTLSGTPEAIEKMRAFLKSVPGFDDMVFKASFWDRQAFKRYFVKVKKEIITFRPVKLDPLEKTGAYLKPQELRQWYESGEDMILVDTRNDFEFDQGTFQGAINPKLTSFSEFADFVENHRVDLKNKKVVTFCTGGIRCEKATAYLLEKGIENVYQLEGGILNYFQQTDGAYFSGSCFVFDERIALDKNLKPVFP